MRREPYWITLTRGCALGYRKGALAGTWIARRTDESGKKHYQALGAADDLNDGNGLGYKEAFESARRLFGVSTASASRLTVAQALDRYLDQLKATNPQSTWYDAEKRVASILKPKLGAIRLAKLCTRDLTVFLDALREDRQPATVNRIWAILKAALNLAWREKLVADDSAWRMVRATKVRRTGRKVFLSPEQCRVLLAHCESEAFRNLVRAGLLTGARYGELARFRVRDFDQATGTLDVNKGKTDWRTVFLSDEAVRLFAELARNRDPGSLLLPRAEGGIWGKNHQQKPMERLVAATKSDPETVFYSLRHTHISLALLAGVNIQVLAENCGTSVRMIELHYGKFLKRDRRAMFDRLPSLDRSQDNRNARPNMSAKTSSKPSGTDVKRRARLARKV